MVRRQFNVLMVGATGFEPVAVQYFQYSLVEFIEKS